MRHADYDEVCKEVTTVAGPCDTTVSLAVSAVTGMPMNQFLVGRDVQSTA